MELLGSAEFRKLKFISYVSYHTSTLEMGVAECGICVRFCALDASSDRVISHYTAALNKILCNLSNGVNYAKAVSNKLS